MISGEIEGTNVPVNLSLLTHRRQRILGGMPEVGDVIGAVHVIHSIYEPRLLLLKDELQQNLMLRRVLPYDITEAYFAIRRPLRCVDV